MSFLQIAEVPLKHMPTDVLIDLRERIAKELDSRGRRGEFVSKEVWDGQRRSRLLRIGRASPTEEQKSLRSRFWQLDALDAQDWSDLFPVGDQERRYYVYAHVNPRQHGLNYGGPFKLFLRGKPFYIGKGSGNRAWQLNRNEGHGVELRQLQALGVAPREIVNIVRENLTEREALELESKLIYFFGTRFEEGRNGLLVNLDIPARPYHVELKKPVEKQPRPMQYNMPEVCIQAENDAQVAPEMNWQAETAPS